MVQEQSQKEFRSYLEKSEWNFYLIEIANEATIILQDLSGNGNGDKPQTAFDLLQNIETERVFSTAQEVDEHLQAERE